MINAFTNAAQKLGPLQRIQIERFAGQVAGSSFAIVLYFGASQAQSLAFSFHTGLPGGALVGHDLTDAHQVKS
jgi:hypothetical protein